MPRVPILLLMLVMLAPGTGRAILPVDPWDVFAELADAIAAKDVNKAMARWTTLQRYEGHPALAAARRIEPRYRALISEPKDDAAFWQSLAELELTLGQVANGISAAALTATAANVDAPAAFGLVLVGGILVPTAALLSFETLTPPQATALNSGSAWGVTLGVVHGELVARRRRAAGGLTDTDQRAFESGLAGQLLGTALGYAWAFGEPDRATVSLVNFGGLSVGLGTLVTLAIVAPSGSGPEYGFEIGSFVGMGLGYAASRFFHPTRGQMLAVELGAFVGTLGGALVAEGTRIRNAPGAIVTVGGGVLGAITGGLVARGLSPADTAVAVVPTDGGAEVVLAARY